MSLLFFFDLGLLLTTGSYLHHEQKLIFKLLSLMMVNDLLLHFSHLIDPV